MKKDISKRKTPFFCISKGLSKTFSCHIHLNFLEKNKITRSGLYQDTNKGGLHENYMGLVFKSFILRQMFAKKINSEFNFKFIHRSIVKRDLLKMMNVCTVDKMTP